MGSAIALRNVRPNLDEISRRPMARAGAGVIVARGHAAGSEGRTLFSTEGALDIDVLHRLLDSAEVVTEGRVYARSDFPPPSDLGRDTSIPPSTEPPSVLLGSTLVSIDLGQGSLNDGADGNLPRRLRDAFISDKRARKVLRDLVYRETARLLGPDTPSSLDVVQSASYQGRQVFVDLDFEAPVDKQPEWSVG